MRQKYTYQTSFQKGWREGYVDVTSIASYQDDLGIEIGRLKLTLPKETRIELYRQLIREDRSILFDVIEDEDYMIFPDVDEVCRFAEEMK